MSERSAPSITELLGTVRIRGRLNDLDDRAAMGLPPSYVSPTFADLRGPVADLRRDSPSRLSALVEDRDCPLHMRLAAGHLLALLGDPRIDAFDPPMVTVEGGTATLGTDLGAVAATVDEFARFGVQREWIEKECPRFRVDVETFRIARHQVTNAEYAIFLTETGFPVMPTSWAHGRAPLACDNHPVFSVTPEAADAYAAWLATATNRRFRLPTEWEWEYAAAGPTGLRYPWGPTFGEQQANTMELGLMSTSPVGCFPEGNTWCAAADMAGNVEELVADTYGPYTGGTLVEDDLWRLLGPYRVARGGAFNRFADLARCQRRHGAHPDMRYAIGFRLAETA